MYSVLGWINISIVVLLLIPFVLLKKVKNKESVLYKTKNVLSKVHRPLGALLIVIAAVHGYLALGTLALHTGTVVAVAAVLTVFLGGMFIAVKKKQLFTAHRALGMVFVALLIIHLVLPSLLS